MGSAEGAAPEAAAPVLALRDVLVGYGGRPALEVSVLEVPEAEVLAVIGPNGAGKSTLLRVLALLEAPARGAVAFRGAVARSAAERLAFRRRMASVFQDPLLCDTSVAANVRLPLLFRGLGRAEADRRVRPWLGRLGIAHVADRGARSLSGGEAQRASLARAFAVEPEVLLLDEPFAALDPPTREALLDDLARLFAEARTTAVFVTHERAEALRLGDRVAVLMDGRIAQIGRPEEVFGAPTDEAVARLVGVENLWPGRVVGGRDGLVEVAVAGHTIAVVGSARIGDPALVGLRPEDVVIEAAGPGRPTSARNRLHGRVVQLAALGPLYRVVVDCGLRLTGVVTRPSAEALGLAPGTPVGVSFKATAAHLIRPKRDRVRWPELP
ncbi:MAG: ABC transporter ATP-binding protein [Candidatus Rokubacteria bacterium]|nr:ABC transporter ATP-binding protein [Candidatus Rokubacteria bacterium]